MGCSHTELEIGNPLIDKTQCSLILHRKGVSVCAHNELSDQLLNLHYHFKQSTQEIMTTFFGRSILKGACKIITRRNSIMTKSNYTIEEDNIVVTWWSNLVL